MRFNNSKSDAFSRFKKIGEVLRTYRKRSVKGKIPVIYDRHVGDATGIVLLVQLTHEMLELMFDENERMNPEIKAKYRNLLRKLYLATKDMSGSVERRNNYDFKSLIQITRDHTSLTNALNFTSDKRFLNGNIDEEWSWYENVAISVFGNDLR